MAADTAYQKAEELIEQARRDGTTKLDLRNMGLTEVPEAIGQLTRLQELYLSNDPFDISSKANNQISSLPEAIGQLSRLQVLSLSGNSISSWPEAIGRLTRLQQLDIRENSISSLPEAIGQLTRLQKLDLSNDMRDIRDIFFDRRKAKNQISSLPEAIGQLSGLQVLNLGRNSISSLPEAIGQLSGLQVLHLDENSISSLPEAIGQLSGLQKLYLQGNSISSLPEAIGQLSQLHVLRLGENRIGSLPEALSQLSQLQVLLLEGNPLNPQFAAAYSQGTEVLLGYLRSIAQDPVRSNEAKLILVGEGEVGKTSLLGALRGDPWEENRPTTHGIEIKPVTVKDPHRDTEIKLNGWDFGGQPVYRPTHQLFFSAPAVYLVVWKPREGPQQGFVEDWINLIKRRAPEAKILVVATHGGPDERQPDIDSYEIIHRFGKDTVLNCLHVDSNPHATDNGIDELKEAIARIAADLPGVRDKVPAKWQQLRAELEGREEAYLSKQQVVELGAKHGMDEKEADLYLLLAHTLGHIIHYRNDTVLQDTVILKPDWLTKALSFVLDDKETRKNRGLVKLSRLNQLWHDPQRPETERYPVEFHGKFLKLMELFDISYPVKEPSSTEPGDSQFLIAQLLSDTRPDTLPGWGENPEQGDKQKQQICSIVDEKGKSAEAEGLFYRLIVRLHKYSLGREDHRQSIHWRRGLLLDDDYNGRALLEYRGTDLWITVRGAFPEYFIGVLIAEVKWLVGDFWKGLECQVMVPCISPCGQDRPGTGLFKVEQLIKSRKRGRKEFPCSICDDVWQDIEQLLGNAPSSTPIEEQQALLRRELASQTDQLRQWFEQQLSKNQERILSQIDLQFTQLQGRLVDEGKDGPRLFSFQPVDPGFLDRPKWVSAKFQLTLWCEHSRQPLPVLNPQDPKRGVYELEIERKWLVKAKPLFELMTTTLRLVLPVAGAATKLVLDDRSYGAIQEELELGQKALDATVQGSSKLLEGSGDEAAAWESRGGVQRGEGGMLRALHAILKEKDPTFGGLVRVQNKRREFLWVHPRFQHEDDYI